MAAGLLFRKLTEDEAKNCIKEWHKQYAGGFIVGSDYFGAELNGRIIAAVIYTDFWMSNTIGELTSTVKAPDIKFQMSQLLKYSRKQLRDKYSILITFCNIHMSKGGQLKGDYWNYGGLMGSKSLDPPRSFLQAYHFYWVPLNKAGQSLASSMGLEALSYPK